MAKRMKQFIKKPIHIICGKFDDNITISKVFITNNKVRIGSKNPNKLDFVNYIPVATDGTSIIHNSKKYIARNFLSTLNSKTAKNLIVLTIKERNLLLEALNDFNIKISIFEVVFPIFSHIKYISNLHKNYEELQRLLSIVHKMNITGKSLAHNLSTQYLYKIERKLRFKQELDFFFAFAYKGGYQEVFKLKEERDDRIIIALDFNSMYVDSMMGDFLEPKKIHYQNFRDNKSIDKNTLENGLYRVVLENAKDTFFKEFHPFKFSKLNKSFYFTLEENQSIEVMLFKNEIEYYKKFFENIIILEGFISKNTIKHPLRNHALKTYSERLKFKNRNDSIQSDLSKFKLITIHSATNPKRYKILFFKNIFAITKYISKHYMIVFPEYMNEIEKLESIQDNNYFTFWKHANGYKVKIVNFKSNESLYSISSQIIANGRLKMIQTIERFLSFESVEICYSNIDSLHISILETKANDFLDTHKDIISNKLGHLKVESISKKGYWFDVGRYWLMDKNNNVLQFKNSLFNQKNKTNKFIKNKKFYIIHKDKTYSYVKTAWVNIEQTFSYHKRLTNNIDCSRYTRYNYKEISNLHVANDTYNEEMLDSKAFKINLFHSIATV